MPLEFHIGLGIPSLQPFWCMEPSLSLASQVMTPKGISSLGCVRNTSPPESMAWLTVSSRWPVHQPVLQQFAVKHYLAVTSRFHLSELTPIFHPWAPMHKHTHPGTPLSPSYTHALHSSHPADQPRPHEMSTQVFWEQVNSDETL